MKQDCYPLTCNIQCKMLHFIQFSYRFHCLAVAEAVECYICSWNPSDYTNGGSGGGGNSNQHDYTDVCSAGHFDPERVRTHDCSKGCEIVSMRNPNGKLTCSVQIGAKLQSHFFTKNSKSENSAPLANDAASVGSQCFKATQCHQ